VKIKYLSNAKINHSNQI